jgi:ABC-type transport system involved in multi-copper enzyme maturation permease subunit
MKVRNLFRSELRKLSTTAMPLAFVAVLVVLAGINAFAVAFGTDADGTKGFISTADDQRSLVAFATNATMLASLFGAIAVARDHGHGTVIYAFLAAPRRHRAVLAQFAAVGFGGALLGLLGAASTILAVALALPTTEYGFLMSAGGVTQVLAASTLCGAVGAVLGAGIGALVRNTGGAVTGAFLVLLVAPPLIVQLASETMSWMPATLATVLSGVTVPEIDVGVAAAAGAMCLWAAVPAALALVAVQKRDVT